jgi:hypothetical protein
MAFALTEFLAVPVARVARGGGGRVPRLLEPPEHAALLLADAQQTLHVRLQLVLGVAELRGKSKREGVKVGSEWMRGGCNRKSGKGFDSLKQKAQSLSF